jgi:two-component system OmpR family response regulator
VRVLVVEDKVKLATVLHRGLRKEGLAADIAANGEDALWMAESTPYDAVVLDVMLPGIDVLRLAGGFDLRRFGRRS